MKKIGFTISLCMGLVMSFALSLTGNLLSGRFTVPTFLLSFAISFTLSLLIGLAVPMKPLSEKVCAIFGAAPRTIKARIISSLLSSLIYTPVMTTVMVLAMTGIAGMNIDRQITEKQAELTALTQEYETAQSEISSLETQLAELSENAPQIETIKEELANHKAAAEEMQKGMEELNGAISGMTAGKPVFIKVWPLSLAVCLAVGFVMSFIFQPLIMQAVMKKYGIRN